MFVVINTLFCDCTHLPVQCWYVPFKFHVPVFTIVRYSDTDQKTKWFVMGTCLVLYIVQLELTGYILFCFTQEYGRSIHMSVNLVKVEHND